VTEHEAQAAIRVALQALTAAQEASERVGYGSMVLDALADARKATQYAADLAAGRR